MMEKLSIFTLKVSWTLLFVTFIDLVIAVSTENDMFKDFAIILSFSGIITSIISIVCYMAAKNAGDL